MEAFIVQLVVTKSITNFLVKKYYYFNFRIADFIKVTIINRKCWFTIMAVSF